MTDEQIFELVKEYLTEEWCEEDGYGWTEFAGKPDAFVKFALVMYNKGICEGAYQQSKRYMEGVFDDD